MKAKGYYYTTRDLLLMAALAALGGISSTYINFIGDFFQSFLGFAGTTQWAAGLHVLWLVLAVGLTKKAGAGTITGILKGGVELFSGNTHGLLVVLVDLVAGVIVDLGVLPFRRKDHWTVYALAGGLASASNVLVFQLFAAIPADILTFGLIGLIALVAFISGVIFAGLLGSGILVTLRKSGVVKDQPVQPLGKNTRWALLTSAVLLVGGLFGFLKFSQTGGGAVTITGAVQAPYTFSPHQTEIAQRLVTSNVNGLSRSYKGYPLTGILGEAVPEENAELVLLKASDGYVFFISFEELESNPGIVLQAQGRKDQVAFNIAGPESKKAWVNGVQEIEVVQSTPLMIQIQEELLTFTPSEWVEDMDSTTLDLGSGPVKVQGVPVGIVLESLAPGLDDDLQVLFESADGNQLRYRLEALRKEDGIRIFVNLSQGEVSYTLADLDGEVFLSALERIEIP